MQLFNQHQEHAGTKKRLGQYAGWNSVLQCTMCRHPAMTHQFLPHTSMASTAWMGLDSTPQHMQQSIPAHEWSCHKAAAVAQTTINSRAFRIKAPNILPGEEDEDSTSRCHCSHRACPQCNLRPEYTWLTPHTPNSMTLIARCYSLSQQQQTIHLILHCKHTRPPGRARSSGHTHCFCNSLSECLASGRVRQ